MVHRPYVLVGLTVAVAGCQPSISAHGASGLRGRNSPAVAAITRHQLNLDQSVLALSRYQVEMRDERRAIAKQARKTADFAP
jgi:hypothetical protein